MGWYSDLFPAIALSNASWLYRNSPLYALATLLLSAGWRSLRKEGTEVGALIDISAAIEVSFIDPIPAGWLTAWQVAWWSRSSSRVGIGITLWYSKLTPALEARVGWLKCGEGLVAPAGNSSYRGFLCLWEIELRRQILLGNLIGFKLLLPSGLYRDLYCWYF
jgi:hypothetical protein